MLLVRDQVKGGREVADAQLGLLAMLNDEAAFDAWYAEALPLVYRYLYSRCGGDSELAEELTQQAFVEAVRHAEQWAGRANLVTWVVSIGRHKLIDHARRTWREQRRHAQLVERVRFATPGEIADTRLDIGRALALLPPDQRYALVLRAADGLTVKEIAGILGRSYEATDSLLRRARIAFRQAYEGTSDA